MSATNNLPILSLEAAKIAAAAAEEKAKELGIGTSINKNIFDSNTNLPGYIYHVPPIPFTFHTHNHHSKLPNPINKPN